MASNNAEQPEAPVALSSTAPRLRRWLPLHLSALALFVIAIVLLIVSMFTTHATPEVELKMQGAFNYLPVDQVFPGDVVAQLDALVNPCQTLMNKGCGVLFPDLTNTSTMLNAMIASANLIDAAVDADMVAEAMPYEFISCEWTANVPPGTQVPFLQWFPSEIVNVKARSTMLPEMVDTSLSVGCQTRPTRGENITTYLIFESTLLGLVEDPTGLQNGSLVVGPNMSDVVAEGTWESAAYNVLPFYGTPPCGSFVQKVCHSDTKAESGIPKYVMIGGQLTKCAPLNGTRAAVRVHVCEETLLQDAYPVNAPTFTTLSKLGYRYRASRDSVQLVAMDDPSRTQSAITGQTTQRFPRDAIACVTNITIIAIVVLGVALVVLVIATSCVACNHKRARKTTVAMQDGMTGPPHAHVIRRSSGYALPPESHCDLHSWAGEAAPYGKAAYYREGEGPSDVELTSAGGVNTQGNQPGGSAKGAARRTDAVQVCAAALMPREGKWLTTLGSERSGGEGFGDPMKSASVTNVTEHDADATGCPKGIPLRVEGSADGCHPCRAQPPSADATHTSRTLPLLIIACVLAVVGTVLVVAALTAQAAGSMERLRRIVAEYSYNLRSTARITGNANGGTTALYAIGLVASLAGTVITWCIVLCKVY